MAVIGEKLENYVIKQINARQTLHGSGVGHTGTLRTDKQINLLNSNTSWIKLASGVSVSEARLKEIKIDDISNLKDMGLAKNNILFSGTSKLSSRDVFNSTTQKTEEQFFLQQREGFLPRDDNSSYTYGSFGFSPMPGIHSADIKTLTRGSLKKATVKLTANNKQQFDIIDLLYMRLGYTVLLEWGNSIYTTTGFDKEILRNTLVEEKFFKAAGSNSYFTFLEDIEEKREKYAGNYDALLGKVSNFNWSFNTDGSYDIELTIISLGDVIESLKSNLSVNSEINTFINTINPQSPDTDTDPTSGDTAFIDEESSSVDIITAMLAIWKFVNRDKKEGNEVKIETPGAAKPEHPIGVLLTRDKDKETIVGSKTSYELKMTVSITLDTNGETFGNGIDKLQGTGRYKVTQKFEQPNTDEGYKAATDQKKEFSKKVKSFTSKDFIENTSKDGLTIEAITPFKVIQSTFVIDVGEIDKDITSEFKPGQQIKNPNIYQRDISNFNDPKTSELIVSRVTDSSSVANPLINFGWNDAFKITTSPDHNYYIRFGALLEYIKDNIIIKIKSTNEPIFKIDHNEWYTHMYSLPNQISLDPRVCIVRNDSIEVGQTNKTKAFSNLQLFKEVNNDNAAYPLNIYLNFNFILECLKADEKGNVSVYELISSICTGLNKALGGINNLEPVIDETNNTLRIIDTTPIPGYSSKESSVRYKLQIYGYDKIDNDYISNFVRKVDLKTAITPEYATMITVGATAGGYVKGVEATAFSKWNTGLVDRFKEEFTPPQATSNGKSDPDEAAANYKETFQVNGYANRYGLTYFGENKKFSDNIIEKNISIVTEYYKWLIAKNSEGEDKLSGGTVGFIPFKLGLTLDGISGIKIYNVLHINTEFLPKAYGKTVDLIVTGVSHRLNDNDWETSIEATVMPKTGEMALITITAKDAATVTNNAATKNPSGYGDVVGCGAPEKYDVSKITKNDKVNQTQAKKLLKKVIAKVIADTNGASRSVCAAYVKRIAKKYFEYYNLDRAVNINKIPSWYQSKVSAGGSHAKNKVTHDWLIRDLGYTRIILGKNLSTSEARSLIDSVTYNIGDIVSYWDHSGNTKGHQIYGHIQIYEGNNSWRSDFKHSSFVYKSYTGCWDIIYLQAPNKPEPILNE